MAVHGDFPPTTLVSVAGCASPTLLLDLCLLHLRECG